MRSSSGPGRRLPSRPKTQIVGRALARCHGFGESLLPTKSVPQSVPTIRFQRPPVAPDTGISSIRRCQSSQCEVYVALRLDSLHQATP